MVWVALAGPGTNVLLAIASSLLFYGVPILPADPAEWIAANLVHSLQINAVLCVFNCCRCRRSTAAGSRSGFCRAARHPLARLEPYGILIVLLMLFVLPWIGARPASTSTFSPM